jgi:5-methylcytosine-specific restriction protein A
VIAPRREAIPKNVQITKRIRGRAAVERRKRRLQRTNGLCERCDAKGRTTAAKVVDHITPLALGGTDEDSNTRNLCKSCHDEVTAEQFGHKAKQPIGRDGWPIT